MIIVAIIALAAVVLLALYAVLASMPALPQGIFTVVNYCAQYLASGAGFFYTFVDRSVVRTLISVTLVVEGVIYGYKFTMWVAKKIPMFGVSD